MGGAFSTDAAAATTSELTAAQEFRAAAEKQAEGEAAAELRADAGDAYAAQTWIQKIKNWPATAAENFSNNLIYLKNSISGSPSKQLSSFPKLTTDEEKAATELITQAKPFKSGNIATEFTPDATTTAEEASSEVDNILKKNPTMSRQQAGLVVVVALAAVGVIASSVILAWYANDNTGCYQIKGGVRGTQMAGGSGSGNYYEWGGYPDRCACSNKSMFSSGSIGTTEVVGGTGFYPSFCSNGIFSRKNTPGSPIVSGTGATGGTGGAAPGQPPYPVCAPIGAEPCGGPENIYYSFYLVGPLSLIANVITQGQLAQGEIAAAAAGKSTGNIVQIVMILAFIALVLFIVLKFVTRPKK
jgi:hypothetical protein